jgi:hypothetical protein
VLFAEFFADVAEKLATLSARYQMMAPVLLVPVPVHYRN